MGTAARQGECIDCLTVGCELNLFTEMNVIALSRELILTSSILGGELSLVSFLIMNLKANAVMAKSPCGRTSSGFGSEAVIVKREPRKVKRRRRFSCVQLYSSGKSAMWTGGGWESEES